MRPSLLLRGLSAFWGSRNSGRIRRERQSLLKLSVREKSEQNGHEMYAFFISSRSPFGYAFAEVSLV